jgi:tRNA threonylcarbamoyladenosine biosynthesis protein TsaB
MLTLTLETSTNPGSWSLHDGTTRMAGGTFQGRASSGLFASLSAAQLPCDRVGQILVGVGPGSFSGIRLAIAAALGWNLATGARIIPLRSSDAVAVQRPHVSFLGVFQDARRGEIFVTCYEQGRLLRPTRVIPAADLETHLSKCTLAVCADPLPGIFERLLPDADRLFLSHQLHGPQEELPLEPVHLRPDLLSHPHSPR